MAQLTDSNLNTDAPSPQNLSVQRPLLFRRLNDHPGINATERFRSNRLFRQSFRLHGNIFQLLTVEERLLSIEQEYVARERLKKFNLVPKRKILLYGPPGCGKTLSAERIAWNLGIPLLKVRFDSLLSSYFGESASNLRMVFDYCKSEPVVLLLDECDFIAKSRITTQDVGEAPRIVNMLLTLLDEYDAPGLVLATTNLKVSLDEALFRRFDDVIEMPMPGKSERKRLLEMTLSAIPASPDVDMDQISNQLDGYSAANIVLIAQRAAKIGVLAGHKKVCNEHFVKALEESSKF